MNTTLNSRLSNFLKNHESFGICCLDAELRYVYINETLANYNCTPASSHIGRHVNEITPSYFQEIREIINQIIQTKHPVKDYKFQGETADPRKNRFWNTCWYPLFDEGDKIIGFGVIVDEITNQKLAEIEIRDRENRLEGINQILRAALKSDTERELGLVCLEVAKNVTQSKVAFINELRGELAAIAVSNPGWDACKILSSGGSSSGSFKIHGIYGRVIAERKSLFTNDPCNHPDSIGLPEGHPPIFSFLGVPLFHEDSLFGIIGVGNREGGYSQTEQDALEALCPSIVEAFMSKRQKDEIEALNHNLELRVERRTHELQESQKRYLHAEKLSAIGKLSASIAHEINSPLQTVSTVLKILEFSVPEETGDRKLLDAAIDEAKRIKNLMRSLQDFYKPSSGRKVLMDVHATIDSVLLLSHIDFRRNNISIGLNYAKRLPQIKAIPDQIKQVFLNLLNNAADACVDEGGVITISTWQDRNRIAVAIQDAGIGIAPDKIDQIFQPFYTTKPEIKGTGLGLSVCHGIIKSHGGEIGVESEPGGGSTFTVFLPIDQETCAN